MAKKVVQACDKFDDAAKQVLIDRLTSALTKTVLQNIQKVFSAIMSPIKEALEEVYVDPFIEGLVSGAAADAGLDETAQILLSGLAESGRETFAGVITQSYRASSSMSSTQISQNLNTMNQAQEQLTQDQLDYLEQKEQEKANKEARNQLLTLAASSILMFAGVFSGGLFGAGSAIGSTLMTIGTVIDSVDDLTEIFEDILKAKRQYVQDEVMISDQYSSLSESSNLEARISDDLYAQLITKKWIDDDVRALVVELSEAQKQEQVPSKIVEKSQALTQYERDMNNYMAFMSRALQPRSGIYLMETSPPDINDITERRDAQVVKSEFDLLGNSKENSIKETFSSSKNKQTLSGKVEEITRLNAINVDGRNLDKILLEYEKNDDRSVKEIKQLEKKYRKETQQISKQFEKDHGIKVPDKFYIDTRVKLDDPKVIEYIKKAIADYNKLPEEFTGIDSPNIYILDYAGEHYDFGGLRDSDGNKISEETKRKKVGEAIYFRENIYLSTSTEMIDNYESPAYLATLSTILHEMGHYVQRKLLKFHISDKGGNPFLKKAWLRIYNAYNSRNENSFREKGDLSVAVNPNEGFAEFFMEYWSADGIKGTSGIRGTRLAYNVKNGLYKNKIHLPPLLINLIQKMELDNELIDTLTKHQDLSKNIKIIIDNDEVLTLGEFMENYENGELAVDTIVEVDSKSVYDTDVKKEIKNYFSNEVARQEDQGGNLELARNIAYYLLEYGKKGEIAHAYRGMFQDYEDIQVFFNSIMGYPKGNYNAKILKSHIPNNN